MSNELVSIQSMFLQGISHNVIHNSPTELGIGYITQLGKSGWLEPNGDPEYPTLPIGIVYPHKPADAVNVRDCTHAIAKMSYHVYKRQYVVMDLVRLVEQLQDGYYLTPTYMADEQVSLYEMQGLVIPDFINGDSKAHETYTKRELERVKSLILHFAGSGKAIILGSASIRTDAIATEWGTNFAAALDKKNFEKIRIPLKGA